VWLSAAPVGDFSVSDALDGMYVTAFVAQALTKSHGMIAVDN
jgi:hypothetical protein